MVKDAIAIIPARGGSKRIPKKNIKEFHGLPLIAYSIKAALSSKLFEKVIVTTDDESIAKVALEFGAEVPFIRPESLSDDYTGTVDVVNHAVEYLESHGEFYEYICTIYATAPFLQAKYLIEGYDKLKNSDAINAFSSTSMPFPIQRTFKLNADSRCEMFTPEHYMSRSQDLEEAYQDAGQFYWTNRKRQNQTQNQVVFSDISIPIVLPRHLVQDIDTIEDWTRAEYMYEALYQDKYDSWNKLKKRLDSRKHNFYIKQGDIYFLSVGQNIGYETYGKDDLFLRPVLVFKKLNKYTFIGIPLTSKKKEGSHFFSFSYKKDKISTAQISQMRMFDIKRIEYRSGRIFTDDFNNLKKKFAELFGLNITPQEEGKLHSINIEQRNNGEIVTNKDENVK